MRERTGIAVLCFGAICVQTLCRQAVANAPSAGLQVEAGFWQVKENTVAGRSESIEKMMADTQSKLLATLSAAQRAEYLSEQSKAQKAAEALRLKGTDQQRNVCVRPNAVFEAFQFSSIGKQNGCTVADQTASGKWRRSIRCISSGATITEESVIEREDSHHYAGKSEHATRMQTGELASSGTKTFTAFWIRANCELSAEDMAKQRVEQGLPARPMGPEAVAKEAPNRQIAEMNGVKITARQGLTMMAGLTPATRKTYEAYLPYLVQRIYMKGAVAQEAHALGLDKQEPWRSDLIHAYTSIVSNHSNASADPNQLFLPAWNAERDRILRQAYYSRATIPEARKQLMEDEIRKYEIKVLDPDFFNGITSPSGPKSVKAAGPEQ